MLINFVISEDKKSRIFSDLFRRFMDADHGLRVTVSEAPVKGADVYHYHRPQMERRLMDRSVVTVHHDLEDPDPFVAYEGFHDRYMEAQRVICLNSIQKRLLSERGIDHTCIIPHGFDSKLFRKKVVRPFDPQRKAVFGLISKRYPRRFKGEAYLYDLLHFLPADRIRFVLVGEGRSRDALHLEHLGFEVECHEVVPYRLFPEVYKVLDHLLMVSTFEGGPANLPEAVGSGTPAICTRVGMVPDMIADGENGLILTGHVREDASRIDALVSNDGGLWDQLARGASSATSAPSWNDVIASHVALYQKITLGSVCPQFPVRADQGTALSPHESLAANLVS